MSCVSFVPLLSAVFCILVGQAQADSACQLDTFSADDLIKNVGRYTAQVVIRNTRYDDTTYTEVGTAFLATFDGYVVTAKHVVASPSNFKKQEIEVRLSANPKLSFVATFVAATTGADIAVLKLATPSGMTHFRDKGRVFSFPNNVGQSDPVIVLGYPIMLGDAPTTPDLRCGHLAGQESEDEGPFWFSTATINPGESGSPVLTSGVTLLALAEGKATETAYLQQTRPINDTYFIQPIPKAFSLISTDRATAPVLAYAPNDDGYDLKSTIDYYYKPPERLVFKVEVDDSPSNGGILPDSTVHNSTITAPSDGTISTCTIRPTASGTNSTPLCKIDPTGSTATISVELQDRSLLVAGDVFKGEASITLTPKSASTSIIVP